jgi:endonuclease YncB( thermonuclease family)
MRKSATCTAALALLVGFVTVLTASSAEARDMDCSDFSTQKSAQIYFLNHGGPNYDPDRLDSDGDGIACESNPCPCYYGTTPPTSQPAPPPTPKQLRQRGRVVHIVDGDTIDVRLRSGVKKRIRLLGIDTPEVYGTVECGGPAASRAMKRLLPLHTRVILLSDTSQDRIDRYGRLLRYVIRARDHRDIDRAQVWLGHARVYVYNNNPFHRVTSYRRALRSAKNHHRGIWGQCG